MSNCVEYKGLKHYPSGEVSLQLKDEALVISGLNSYRDGLTIETKGSSDWNAHLHPLTINRDTTLGSTFNIIDGLKRMKTVAQWTLTQSPDGKYAYLAVNSKLEGAEIKLAGTKTGIEVFEKVYIRSGDPGCHWMILAMFALADAPVFLSNIFYKLEAQRNRQDRITRTTTVKSFGGGGIVHPLSKGACLTSASIKPGRERYEVDQFYITSSLNYPEGLPKELEGSISQVIFTGQDIDPFIFIDERHNN